MLHHGVIAFLSLGGRDIADRLQQPAVVELIHPFQRCELDGLKVPPWPTSMYDLGFARTVDRFGQSIVVGVANACDRGLDNRHRQSLRVYDRDILGSRRRCGGRSGPPASRSRRLRVADASRPWADGPASRVLNLARFELADLHAPKRNT